MNQSFECPRFMSRTWAPNIQGKNDHRGIDEVGALPLRARGLSETIGQEMSLLSEGSLDSRRPVETFLYLDTFFFLGDESLGWGSNSFSFSGRKKER